MTMWQPTVNRSGDKGVFSLVEMIVVITVLFLLISITLPQLQRAQLMGLKTTCINNLHSTGTALGSYELDHGRYPTADPLLGHLMAEGYMLKMTDFRCSADTSAAGDTYSMGFLGTHPSTNSEHTALVVCGWHPLFGTMASFFDHSVDVLTDRAGDVSLPVTFNYGGADVEPGFVLHDQTPITVASADGNEILVYGDEGAYFIAASYDPFANLGRGRFALTLGFNANDMDEQEISAQSANADIQFIIRAGDITARLTFAANSEARVEFDRHNDHTHLNIYDYKAFDVTHRATGERYAQSYIPGVTPGQNNQRFKSFPNFLYGYGLSPGVSPDFDDE